MINALHAPVEAAWRELDDADQAAAAIPARNPLGTLAPDMVRLDAETKQITHAIRMARLLYGRRMAIRTPSHPVGRGSDLLPSGPNSLFGEESRQKPMADAPPMLSYP